MFTTHMRPWTRLLALTTQFHTHTMPSPSSFAIVAGVGPGTGATVARKFAASYPVALLARNPANYEDLVKEIQSSGGKAIGISSDVSDAASVKSAFSKINSEFGDAKLAAAVYNVGGGFIRKGFLDLTEKEFESGWEANGYDPQAHCAPRTYLLIQLPVDAAHSSSPSPHSPFCSTPPIPRSSIRLPSSSPVPPRASGALLFALPSLPGNSPSVL